MCLSLSLFAATARTSRSACSRRSRACGGSPRAAGSRRASAPRSPRRACDPPSGRWSSSAGSRRASRPRAARACSRAASGSCSQRRARVRAISRAGATDRSISLALAVSALSGMKLRSIRPRRRLSLARTPPPKAVRVPRQPRRDPRRALGADAARVPALRARPLASAPLRAPRSGVKLKRPAIAPSRALLLLLLLLLLAPLGNTRTRCNCSSTRCSRSRRSRSTPRSARGGSTSRACSLTLTAQP